MVSWFGEARVAARNGSWSNSGLAADVGAACHPLASRHAHEDQKPESKFTPVGTPSPLGQRNIGCSAAPAPPMSVPCNPAFALLREAQSVLLLQGPVGPFLDRMASWLEGRGAHVRRIVFQGGDRRDAQHGEVLAYAGTPVQWPAFLREQLLRERPDCIVLFGQSRACHRGALQEAGKLGVPVAVLEEGYFRPGYVTMELGGVNSHSETLERYRWLPSGDAPAAGLAPRDCAWHFVRMAWHAACHYAAMHLRRHDYPHYEHHRSAVPWAYGAYWLRSWAVKLLRLPADRLRQNWLVTGTRPYYFVPLQHDGDAQIKHHSGYARNAEFVLEVMHSFSDHADAGAVLVFKQHPQSRGVPGHGLLIRRIAQDLGIAHRVAYVVEGDTQRLCRHARGVVVINSTVGLQALQAGTPLAVMGQAVYQRPGLTHAGPLHTFWRDPRPAEPDDADAFLLQLKNLTQMPASIYAGRHEPLDWT